MLNNIFKKTHILVKNVIKLFFNLIIVYVYMLFKIVIRLFILIVKLPITITTVFHFYLVRQFKTFRARVYWRRFQPILITKKNAKKVLYFGKWFIITVIILLLIIWTEKTVNLQSNFDKIFNEIKVDLTSEYTKLKEEFLFWPGRVDFSVSEIADNNYNDTEDWILRIIEQFWYIICYCSVWFVVKWGCSVLIIQYTLFALISIVDKVMLFIALCLTDFITNSINEFFFLLDELEDILVMVVAYLISTLESFLDEFFWNFSKDLQNKAESFQNNILYSLVEIFLYIEENQDNYLYFCLLSLLKFIIFLPDILAFFINFINTELLLYLNQVIYKYYLYGCINFSILFNNNPIFIIVLNIIIILLFILIGGVIPLIERKYLSLIQRRVGPKFVGYNGRLQFIADALKLLFKEIIFLINTNKLSFVLLPIFLLNLNIFLLINLVWLNNLSYIDNEYLILLILLIELITTICTAYIGFLVKNKYTIIASTRILNGIVVFEIFLITLYFYLYILNSKLSLDNVYYNQVFNIKLKVNLIILPPIIYAVLLNLKKVPFDIIEAETELIMGFTTEHSGFLGAALLLIEYLHLFLWSFLILTLFIL